MSAYQLQASQTAARGGLTNLQLAHCGMGLSQMPLSGSESKDGAERKRVGAAGAQPQQQSQGGGAGGGGGGRSGSAQGLRPDHLTLQQPTVAFGATERMSGLQML